MNDPPPEIAILLLGDDSCGKTTFLSRLSLGHIPNSGDKSQATDVLSTSSDSGIALPALHDINQPFLFNTAYFNRPYVLKVYDNDCPEEWRLLDPDIIILCFDIGNPSSLRGLKERWFREVGLEMLDGEERAERKMLVLGLKRDVRYRISEFDREVSLSREMDGGSSVSFASEDVRGRDSSLRISSLQSSREKLIENDSNGERGVERDEYRDEGMREHFVIPQEGHRYAMEMRADGYMECSALTGELIWEVWEDIVRCGVKAVTGGRGDGGWGACDIM